MILPVSLTTAGACALVNFWLGWRVAQVRLKEKIFLGDGGSELLTARMRAHANFVEYAPFVLILLVLVEFAQAANLWLWGAAALFVVGRILHAFGMDGWRLGRQTGIAATYLVMLGLAVMAVRLAFTVANPLH